MFAHRVKALLWLDDTPIGRIVRMRWNSDDGCPGASVQVLVNGWMKTRKIRIPDAMDREVVATIPIVVNNESRPLESK